MHLRWGMLQPPTVAGNAWRLTNRVSSAAVADFAQLVHDVLQQVQIAADANMYAPPWQLPADAQPRVKQFETSMTAHMSS